MHGRLILCTDVTCVRRAGKKLFIYHACKDPGAKQRYESTYDEQGNDWRAIITRTAPAADDQGAAGACEGGAAGAGGGGGADLQHLLAYNDKPVAIAPVSFGRKRKCRR